MDIKRSLCEVILEETEAVGGCLDAISDHHALLCESIAQCVGRLVITGVGKAGLVGKKLVATFASTGTPSIFLNPVDALHGDLGVVGRDDLVLVLSNSAKTDELIRLVPHIRKLGARVWLMTGDGTGDLCKPGMVDGVVCYGKCEEAGNLKLAPSCSTMAMMALGDAIALTVMEMRDFSSEDFIRYHPAGALGGKALTVSAVMRTRFARVRRGLTLYDVSRAMTEARCGICIVSPQHDTSLLGVITDGDLRRAMASPVHSEFATDIMTTNPLVFNESCTIGEAMRMMSEHRINSAPVKNAEGSVVGIVDIQDLIGLRLAT